MESMIIRKRRIGVCLVLSFLTFGIYILYWTYLLVKNTRIIQKDTSSCKREMLCILFLPFFSLFWWITRGKTVKEKFAEYGCPAVGSETIYLILGIVGLKIVSMAIMQNDFNSLPAKSDKEAKQEAQQRAQRMMLEERKKQLYSSDVNDDVLYKMKDLVDAGILSQEEFESKKKEYEAKRKELEIAGKEQEAKRKEDLDHFMTVDEMILNLKKMKGLVLKGVLSEEEFEKKKTELKPLRRLRQMVDSGVISQEEYEAKKAEIAKIYE